MTNPRKIPRTPRKIEIAITSRCNLRCAYCAHFTSAADVEQDLPLKEWLAFFDELGTNGLMSTTISGGEPFVRDDIKEIIRGIIRNHMRFSLLSNGTLITDDLAEFIASTKRCDSVQVSIDGAEASAHDATRGAGCFSRAISGLKNLLARGIHATVRVTITRHNVDKLESISRLLLEDLKLPSFSTNSASYLGMCRKNPDLRLSVSERAWAMKELLRLNQIFSNRITAAAGPLAEARMWAEMENARQKNLPALENRGFLRACNGSSKQISVRADGVLVPCLQLCHMELGKINKDSLADVWLNNPELNEFRSRSDIPLSNFKKCQECAYLNYCSGNCPAVAFSFTGSEYQPSPDACLREYLDAGGVLPKEVLVNA